MTPAKRRLFQIIPKIKKLTLACFWLWSGKTGPDRPVKQLVSEHSEAMKKLCALILLGGFMLPCASRAIDFKQAKFTQVVNSVEVISSDQARHPAEVNGIFKIPDVLRTGAASRAELVADDNTITRVGANTVFSFDPANRTIDLRQGSLLFHSPHGKGGGTVHTGSATASVLGTTIVVTTTPNGGFKVLVLEGEAEIRFLNGLHTTLTPGQMTFVLPGGGTSPIVIFRLDKETSGSLLVNGFNEPLPSWSKIKTEITRQLILLSNRKLQDTGLVVGNNATPNTVQVRMNILNNQPSSSFDTDSSIIGTDHTPNQPAPVNYPPLDTAHVENNPFTPPMLNSDPTQDSFNQGLLFLGIVNPVTGGSPASGFVGNNMDIDTANVDLTSFANNPDFDIMAAGGLRLWQSVNFTPSFLMGGGGDGGVVTTGESPIPLSLVSGQPDTIALFAGGQMSIAPNSTLEADTKIFGLVAGSFGVLDTTTGLADTGYPNTLHNVSFINQVGDVDILSLSDLTIEGMNSAYTVQAAGDANIESEGALTLGQLVGGNGTVIEADGNVTASANGHLDLDNAAVLAGYYGDLVGVNLNSVSGGIFVGNSVIKAVGTVNLAANGTISLSDASITTIGGDVNLSTGGSVDLESSTVAASGSTGNVTVNADAGITVNGATVSGDAVVGTVTLNSTSGQTTIENGASAQAFYLNVNSPDGILIDGTSGGGIHLSGNTMNLTSSLGNAADDVSDGHKVEIENTDLSSFQAVNVQAHSVYLDNVNFSSLSSYNFTSFHGGYYIDDGHQAGYVNFNNDTVDHNAIVNLATPGTLNPNNNAGISLVNSASGSPGLHVVTGP